MTKRRNIGDSLLAAGEKTQGRIRLFFLKSGMDMPFLIILLAILALGLVSLYSASYAYAYHYSGDSYQYIGRQLFFAGLGLVAMFAVSTIDYHVLHKFAWPVLGIAALLLIVVLFVPSESGIRRWIPIPLVGQFQPSEVAKFAEILIFAHLISINYKKMKGFKSGYIPFIVLMGLLAGLVFIEPHLSGAILILSIGLIMMYVGGTRLIYIVGTLALGAAAVLYMVFGMGYEQDRIAVWFDPVGTFESNVVFDNGLTGRDVAWQTIQSLYAIGSGGLMGQGLGNSRQKHLFLPEPQNDFIFAVVCEELGFVGAVVIILLFVLLIWRGITIAMKAPDKFGCMLALGLTVQVGVQVALNLAVVTNTILNTGISLPFFSYGGTSLVMLLAQMGIVLAISRQTKKDR